MIDAERDFATMQDFIVGRLSDDEQRAFEDRLARESELVRELEHSLRMREGLRRLRAQGYLGEAASRVRNSRVWIPALAAAACAGLALFLWLSRVTGPAGILVASLESRASTNPSVAAHFTFVSMRGASAPDLALPSRGLIEFRAAPSTREGVHRYRMMLVREQENGASESVGALAGLAVSTDGYVHGYADASRLAPGRYALRIQPDSDTPGMAEVFPFNLRAGGTGSSP